jgi:signal transduction histidine kinase
LLTIFADHDIKNVLAKAVDGITEVCKGLNCSIFLWNEYRKRFVLEASKGLPMDHIGKAEYDLGEGLTGWVGQHGKPLILDARSERNLKRIDPTLRWKGKYSESTMSKDLGLRPFIAVPILRDDDTVGIIRVCDKAEGVFGESDEQVMTIVASHVSHALAYSDRYRDKLSLLDKLRKLMAVTPEFAEIDKIDDFERSILEEAGRNAAEVLGTSVLTIYKFNAESGAFRTPPIPIGNLRHAEFMKTPIHRDDLPWFVMEKGSRYWTQARRVKKLTERVQARDGLPQRFRFVSREGIVSSAGIRLEVGQRKVGVMFLNFREHQRFDPELRKMIEAFANQIALSIEIATLFRRAKDSASREEADYLAQDLHDGVLPALGHVLSLAGSALDALRVTGRLSSDENLRFAGENLRTIEKATQHCQNECADVMYLLKTHAVDDLGLKKALREFVNDWRRPGVEVGLKLKFAQLSKNLQRHVYRIVQQAYCNALDHSGATEISIAIEERGNLLKVTIEDNGRGFHPAAEHDSAQIPSDQLEGLWRKRGYGLDGMKARVERAMAGRFTLISSLNSGTKITAQIPIGGISQ